MGLIRVLKESIKGELADQYLDYFNCDTLSEDVLVAKGIKKGNFISYVRNARKIFNDEIKIANVEKNHMRNIARAIKQKKLKYSK